MYIDMYFVNSVKKKNMHKQEKSKVNKDLIYISILKLISKLAITLMTFFS